MPWTLKFWTTGNPNATPPVLPVTWNHGIYPQPQDVGGQASIIEQHINSIAAASTLASTRLNNFGQHIRIGFRAGDVGQAYFDSAIDAYILIDLNASETLYFFNTLGQLVKGDIRLTIMHELAHIYLGKGDPSQTANELTMNGADFDFRGPVINEQNAIAQNASLSNQIQTNYYATILSTDTTLYNYFQKNFSFSDGNYVEIARFGEAIANTIDHSNNTIKTVDLLFGMGGDDTIKAGRGNDYLYGGDNKDKLFGGEGSDVLLGQNHDDEFKGEAGADLLHGGDYHIYSAGRIQIEDDGIDTADYSDQGAAVKIRLIPSAEGDQTFAARTGTDFTRAAFVETTADAGGAGQPGAVDTLISIEKLKGTSHTDTLYIKELTALMLAGNDHKGGLDEINLDNSPSGRDNGDLIDLTDMAVAVSVNLDDERLQLKDTPSVGFKIENAERVIGGSGADVFIGDDKENVIVGRGGADELRGGLGNDIIDGFTGEDTAAADSLYGGDGSDTFKTGGGDVIHDWQPTDSVFLNGAPLSGGNQIEEGSSTYRGADGSTYTWTEGSTTLAVTGANGASITIEGFQNVPGGGIRLHLKEPEPSDPPCGCGTGGPGGGDPGGGDPGGPGGGDPGGPGGGDPGGPGGGTGGPGSGHDPRCPTEPGNGPPSGGPGDGNSNPNAPIHPFVIDLGGDGVDLLSLTNSRAFFDFDANGFAEWTSWVAPNDGLLAVDLNGNGTIDDHSELFEAAQTLGFQALAVFDSDGNGLLNASDEAFGQLKLWVDADGNGYTNYGELKSLTEVGVTEISLIATAISQVVEGNTISSSAAVHLSGGITTSIYEVWFNTNAHYSLYTGTDWILDEESDFLVPHFYGHGTIPDLLIAGAKDSVLKSMVIDLLYSEAHDITTTAGLADYRSAVEEILFRWAGIEDVDPTSQGPGVNAVHLAFWEKFYGRSYDDFAPTHSEQMLEVAYQHVLDNYTIRFFSQDDDNPLPIWVEPETERLGGNLDEILAQIEILRPVDTEAQAAFESWAKTVVRMFVFDIDGGFSVVTNWLRGASSLTGGSGDDLVQGTAANDTLNGGNGDDVLVGGAGNDVIHAGDGYDAIQGGAGDDDLRGGEGTDTYIYFIGDGNDLITDSKVTAIDKILFGPGIRPDTVRLIRSASDADDVVITFINQPGSITLNEKATSEDDGVHEIHFSNGTVWDEQDILLAFVKGQATTGDDTINGTYLNDRLDGGTGNDILRGGWANDTYVFARDSGQDIVRDSIAIGNRGGTDTVELAADITTADITVVQSGHDLILKINGTTDQLTLDDTMDNDGDYERIEQVKFADGTIWTHADLFARATLNNGGSDAFYGGPESEMINGGAGNDTLVGNMGNDILDGGAGNDLLRGGGNNDTFIFARGYGQDVINENIEVGNRGGTDIILLGSDISPGDVTVVQGDGGRDLILKVNGTTDQITIDDSVIDSLLRVEEVRFVDGTVWTYSKLLELSIGATDGNDVLSGDAGANSMFGGAGNDTLTGNGGNDRLDGGIGNDLLRGGVGDDTYLFGRGSGQDIVRDSIAVGNRGGTDTVELAADITTADITVMLTGYDLILKINGTTDQILLDDTMDNDGAYERIEQVRFADGTVWNHADLFARAMLNNGGNDAFYGGPESETITGGAGNDTLVGNEGNDVLDGGTGNDLLQGGWANDTYIFGRGSGQDIVRDSIAVGNRGGTDTVELAADITTADITVMLTGYDLILKINGTTDQLTLDDTMDNDGAFERIEQVRFADGTVWTHADLIARAMLNNGGNDAFYGGPESETLTGGAGNDTLVGNEGNDILDGGTGNDLLQGGWANDTYMFGRNYGQDIVRDSIGVGNRGGTDTVELGADITTADITVVQSGDDLILKINGTTDQLTLDDTMDNDGAFERIEQVRFADGTVWTHADLFARLMLNNGGNDTFYGGPEGDAIYGGVGNDTLYGLLGNDGFFAGSNEGYDAFDGGSGSDTLSATANDVIIGVRSLTSVEMITAAGFTGVIVQGSANADVLNLSTVTLTGIDYIDGSGGNDTLTGSAAADMLWGGAGDDVLKGGAGNDTLDGGIGIDKAQFAGARSTYTITTSAGAISIVDNAPTTDGNDGTDTLAAIEQAQFKDQTINLATPIILDLDGDGVHLVNATRSKARFDWNGDGRADKTGWMGRGDGMLVFDRDHNGTVSGASELSFIDDKAGAKSDLDGLSAFDSNLDGVLSGADLAWKDFHIWRDGDGDGNVDAGEYLSMDDAGVTSISLTGAATEQTWGWEDNIVINNGTFTRSDGTTAALADVALNYSASQPHRPTSPLPRNWRENWGERWSDEALDGRWQREDFIPSEVFPIFQDAALESGLFDSLHDDGVEWDNILRLTDLFQGTGKTSATRSCDFVPENPLDVGPANRSDVSASQFIDANSVFDLQSVAGIDFPTAELPNPWRESSWFGPLDYPIPL